MPKNKFSLEQSQRLEVFKQLESIKKDVTAGIYQRAGCSYEIEVLIDALRCIIAGEFEELNEYFQSYKPEFLRVSVELDKYLTVRKQVKIIKCLLELGAYGECPYDPLLIEQALSVLRSWSIDDDPRSALMRDVTFLISGQDTSEFKNVEI